MKILKTGIYKNIWMNRLIMDVKQTYLIKKITVCILIIVKSNR